MKDGADNGFVSCGDRGAQFDTALVRSSVFRRFGWTTAFGRLKAELQTKLHVCVGAVPNCTTMRGDHAQSRQSTATEYSRPGPDFCATHIKVQGNGLLICTCLVQLQMRLVCPGANTSWIHNSYEPGLLVGFDEL